MVKKKDTEEEQKKKLVTEIILLMYPSIGINPPTRKETTLERENRERLEEAVDPSHTNNSGIKDMLVLFHLSFMTGGEQVFIVSSDFLHFLNNIP